jgi:hypothetical protein
LTIGYVAEIKLIQCFQGNTLVGISLSLCCGFAD